MTRHFIEMRSLSDWQSRLGDPELHWKRGASAMELAVSWTLARRFPRGMPSHIASLLDSSEHLAGASVEFAIPELRTKLPGGSTASQTDLWALLRNHHGTIALSVEGKALEPFGETVDRWLGRSRPDRPSSRGQLERIKFICQRLGLDESTIGGLRYQLLHRTAAALREAESWRASCAVVLVQRFARVPGEQAASWPDFLEFAHRLQAQVVPGSMVRAVVPGAVPLYLAWLDCELANDADLLSAMLDRPSRNAPPMSNAFEALCSLASRESWCWNLACTTCGCMHFRYGLMEMSRGGHPGRKNWVTRKNANSRRISERLGALPRIPFEREIQKQIISIASTAKLDVISANARFPDWLGYLGVVLDYCRTDEAEGQLLTRSWVPQLCDLLPAGSSVRQRLLAYPETGRVLLVGDLELIERELELLQR